MHDLPVIGWREWLVLPDLGVSAIKAKVDTGARSSSLHVESLEVIEHGERPLLRFVVDTGHLGAGRVACEAFACDRRDVVDSGGHSSLRWFIRTAVRLGSAVWSAEINLSSRHNMLFPMLLGRSALRERFCVDPGQSYLRGGRPVRVRA